MSKKELDQAQLLTYVHRALDALEKRLGHLPTTAQVQVYLRSTFGIRVSRERIKLAGDDIREISRQEHEEVS